MNTWRPPAETSGETLITAQPRLVVSAPSSGHGKTAIAVGLLAALSGRGIPTAGFKVGPDHTDAAYLGLAAGRPGRNLDPRLVGAQRVAPLFAHGASGAQVSVIEGAMGLFDSLTGQPEVDGTASVAAALRAPVVLVVDVAAMGHSLAALVHGFRMFDEMVHLGGVILNRVASERHEQMLRSAMDDIGMPVLGALHRGDLPNVLPARTHGLVPVAHRTVEAGRAVRRLGEAVAGSLDMDRLMALAGSAPPVPGPLWTPAEAAGEGQFDKRPVIALAGGQGAPYTYVETAELLTAAGADVAVVDPLRDEALPPGTRGLIVGAGLPEGYAEELSANRRLCAAVAQFARDGWPIIAEGIALPWLGHELDGRPMCGVLDATAATSEQTVAGYREATAPSTSVLAPAGARITGYKQHRAVVTPRAGATPAWTWSGGNPEGFVWRQVHASQLGLHWAAAPEIARRLVAAAHAGPQSAQAPQGPMSSAQPPNVSTGSPSASNGHPDIQPAPGPGVPPGHGPGMPPGTGAPAAPGPPVPGQSPPQGAPAGQGPRTKPAQPMQTSGFPVHQSPVRNHSGQSGPVITGEVVSGEVVSGPRGSGPGYSGPVFPGPSFSGRPASGPAFAGPNASGPGHFGPGGPGAGFPGHSRPVSSFPGTTGPASSFPAFDSPDAAHPGPDSAFDGPDFAYPGPDSAFDGPDSAYPGPDSVFDGPDSAYPVSEGSFSGSEGTGSDFPDQNRSAPDFPSQNRSGPGSPVRPGTPSRGPGPGDPDAENALQGMPTQVMPFHTGSPTSPGPGTPSADDQAQPGYPGAVSSPGDFPGFNVPSHSGDHSGPGTPSGPGNSSGPGAPTGSGGFFGPGMPASPGSRDFPGPGMPSGPGGYSGPGMPSGPGGYSGSSMSSGQGGYSGPDMPSGPGGYSGPGMPSGPGGYSGSGMSSGPGGYSGSGMPSGQGGYSGSGLPPGVTLKPGAGASENQRQGIPPVPGPGRPDLRAPGGPGVRADTQSSPDGRSSDLPIR